MGVITLMIKKSLFKKEDKGTFEKIAKQKKKGKVR